MLLVTTSLRESFDDSKEMYFLGQWCLQYGEQYGNTSRSMVQDFHWLDRRKIYSDYQYIKDLNEKILSRLQDVLNDIHEVNYSNRYWRIVLGPWINLLTPILWDRYESLRIAFSRNDLTETILVGGNDFTLIPEDYDDFTQLLNDHLWNHQLYYLLIEKYFLPDNKINVFKKASPRKNSESTKSTINKHSLKRKVYILLDKIISKLSPSQKIVAFNSYFDNLSLLKLLFQFRQLPRKYYEFSKRPDCSQCITFDRSIKLGIQENSFFEKIINELYLSLMPKTYLEYFEVFCRNAAGIDIKSKIILSGVSHYNNDLFKIWAADKTEAGNRFFCCVHGGGIPFKMSLTALHEELISDRRVTWHKEFDEKHYKLPPAKLLRHLKTRKRSEAFVSLIGWDVPLYSYYAQSGPMSSLILDDYDQKKKMIESLSSSAFAALSIRPEPGDRGWSIRNRYINDFGAGKIS